MPDKFREDRFSWSKDSHPVEITSQEQWDKLRAQAKKEEQERKKRMEEYAKSDKTSGK